METAEFNQILSYLLSENASDRYLKNVFKFSLDLFHISFWGFDLHLD